MRRLAAPVDQRDRAGQAACGDVTLIEKAIDIGETIRVQDPAFLPSSPVAPKRFLLTLLGTGIGLALGLMLAALFEIPRLFKIQNIDDAKHYTGLPVLASVPPLLSVAEKNWIRKAGWLKLAAGTAVAIGIIPLIIFILQLTRLFDKFVS